MRPSLPLRQRHQDQAGIVAPDHHGQRVAFRLQRQARRLLCRWVFVRCGKGDKDRSTLLPVSLVAALQAYLARVKALHEADLADGHGEARLPNALDRKYPSAGKEWAWQYVFPSNIPSRDREDGTLRRFHTVESNMQKAVHEPLRKAGIPKHAGVMRAGSRGWSHGWLLAFAGVGARL